jgi:hypothetical protein
MPLAVGHAVMLGVAFATVTLAVPATELQFVVSAGVKVTP